MSIPNAANGNPQAGVPEANPTPVNPQAGQAGANQSSNSASSAGNPQAGVPDANAQAQNTQPPSPAMSLEDAMAALEKSRLENAQHRTQNRDMAAQLKTLQDAEQARKDAELSELERAQKQAAEWQQKHADTTRAMQERIVGLMIEVQAGKLNIIDPDAAVKLMDWTALEYDDDGVPTNAAKVLADLVKARPYLVATPAAQATNGAQAAGNAPTDANAALAAHLGATNAERQNGPVTVTANQYLDKTFRADFKLRYGMELDKAVLSGKATIV